MTVEEAIKYAEKKKLRLEEEIERPGSAYGAYEMHSTELEFVSMALSAICAKQENPFGGWISVKDKLPEDDQEVILCTRETETYGKHREKKKIYKNIYIGYFDGYEWLTSYCHGCEYIFRMNEKYPNETIEVTHWMPLPSTEGLK